MGFAALNPSYGLAEMEPKRNLKAAAKPTKAKNVKQMSLAPFQPSLLLEGP